MTETNTFFHNGPEDYPVLDWTGYCVRAVQHDARAWPPAQADINRILVIKYDAYGDYILHTPFYASLRKFYPQAKITLLCNRLVYELAEHNPAFDFVVKAPYAPGYNQSEAFMFAIELQNHAAATPFDLVIVPRWHEDWHHAGVIAQTLDAPYRLSYSSNTTPFKAANFPEHDNYFTHVIDDARPAHEVWRGMQLLHVLGMDMPPVANIKQEIHTTYADVEKINTLLNDFPPPRGLNAMRSGGIAKQSGGGDFEKNLQIHPLPPATQAPSPLEGEGNTWDRPWIGFGVGASGDFKCWPAHHFAALAAQILAAIKGTIFIFGHGAKDEAAAALIEQQNPTGIINMVGQFSARESTLLIGKCNAMVCNDSFTLHAAATHGVPIVEIIGEPADGRPDSEYLPWCFGPWGAPFAWLQPATCNGSHNLSADFRGDAKCIADVPPDAVFNALTEVMQRWPKPD